MQNKILSIYPISKEFMELVKYKDMAGTYEKVIPIALPGQGIDNRDVSELIKSEKTGIRVTTDFEESIAESSDIIFTRLTDDWLDRAKYAAQNKTNIMLLFPVHPGLENEIIETCKQTGAQYKNYCVSKEFPVKAHDRKLKQNNVPVILICGLSDNTQKFDLQLLFRAALLKRGYAVSQIGSREYASLFGMHNFPPFMLGGMEETEKIYAFNQYLSQIESEEKPEIIIIGVPGGVMPYDMDHPNGFGVTNYLISNAVNADCVILSLAYNDYDETFWNFITNYMKYKYDYEIKGFHLSNIYHDIYGDERNENERLIYIGRDKMRKKVETFQKKNVYDFKDHDTVNRFVDRLIEYLAN